MALRAEAGATVPANATSYSITVRVHMCSFEMSTRLQEFRRDGPLSTR